VYAGNAFGGAGADEVYVGTENLVDAIVRISVASYGDEAGRFEDIFDRLFCCATKGGNSSYDGKRECGRCFLKI
jgi:hypothetical protein